VYLTVLRVDGCGQGQQQVDSMGRQQKNVTLLLGENKGMCVRVRKMGAHGGFVHGQDPKKDRPGWQRRKKKATI